MKIKLFGVQIRKLLGVSQFYIAAQSKIPRSRIQLFEQGFGEPSEKELLNYFNALHREINKQTKNLALIKEELNKENA